MSSLLPWPEVLLTAVTWPSVRRALERCRALLCGSALPHTLLLVGAPGLGREALATELAAGLVCHTGELGCNCASCARVRRGVHPDVSFVDVLPGKKEISIDQIRQVVEQLAQLPFEGARRVVVITSAHTPPLNAEAASALLKSLEEPPGHVTFLLLAANPARLLPTVVSRAVQLRVPSPSEAEATALIHALHGIAPEAAGALLADTGFDPAMLIRDGEELLGVAEVLGGVVGATLAGDTLGMLRLGGVARQLPESTVLAAALLVHRAGQRDASPEAAEAALSAASALLRAEQRRAVLHVDAESAVIGALAPLFVRGELGEESAFSP